MKKFSEIKEDFTDWIIGATKEDFLNVVIIYSKRLGLIALGFVLALIVNVIFSTPVEGTEEYKTLNSLHESSKEYGESLNEKVTELKKSIKDLEEENSLLTKKVEEAAPWFEMKEEERKAEEERIAQEKAQKEAEEKAKKEAEEKAAAEKKAPHPGFSDLCSRHSDSASLRCIPSGIGSILKCRNDRPRTWKQVTCAVEEQLCRASGLPSGFPASGNTAAAGKDSVFYTASGRYETEDL